MSVMMDRIKPPSEVLEGVPEGLDMIVTRALARTPQQRYATARELGRDLMQFVRSSTSAVGMVELEQLMASMFPKELDASRRLLQGARLASIEDTQWSDATPSGSSGRSATRSTILRARASSAASGPIELRESNASVVRKTSGPDDSVAHQPIRSDTLFGSTTVQRLRGMKMLALTLSLAGGVAVALTWGMGRHTEPATPTSVAMTPAPPSPAAVSSAAAVLPQAAQPAVAPAADAGSFRAVAKLEGEAPAPELASASDNKPSPRHRRAEPNPASWAKRDLPSAVRSAAKVETTPAVPSAVVAPAPVEDPAEKPASEATTLPVGATSNTAEPAAAASTALRTAPVSSVAEPAARPVAPAPLPKKQEPLAAKVSYGSMKVEGSLGSGVVGRMLARAEPLLQKCYATAATKAGRNEYVSLAASLSIDEMGAVRLLQQGSHPLPGLATCVADSLKRLRSERKPDVGTVRVELEVSFRAP
jgi:hypothetical protein